MQKKVLLISLAGGVGSRLWPLTLSFPKPLIPFGPTNKLIDIGLSAALEARIRNIFVLTQYQANRVNQYVNGWQRFCNMEMGEWIKLFSPTHAQDFFQTDGHSLLRLWQEHQSEILHFDTVIIAMSDQVYSIDYAHMLDSFSDTQADMQIAFVPVTKERALNSFGVLEIHSSGRVTSIHEKPTRLEQISSLSQTDPSLCPANIALYILKTSVFQNMVEHIASTGDPNLTLSRSGIPFLLQGFNCSAYDIRTSVVPGAAPEQTGSFEDLGTIQEYYDYLMRLTQPGGRFYNLRNRQFPLHSGITVPPVELIFDSANIHNSLFGSGVVVQGSPGQEVNFMNAIICEQVIIGSGADVNHSIVFPNSKIGPNARLTNCIIGENVIVPDDLVLGPQNLPLSATMNHDVYLRTYATATNPQGILSVPVLVNDNILVIPNNYTFNS